jgi:hypothetical protein
VLPRDLGERLDELRPPTLPPGDTAAPGHPVGHRQAVVAAYDVQAQVDARGVPAEQASPSST